MNTTFFFCPHCLSGEDPVLKHTMWSCGTRFNDTEKRTNSCYRKQLEKIKCGLIKVEIVKE